MGENLSQPEHTKITQEITLGSLSQSFSNFREQVGGPCQWCKTMDQVGCCGTTSLQPWTHMCHDEFSIPKQVTSDSFGRLDELTLYQVAECTFHLPLTKLLVVTVCLKVGGGTCYTCLDSLLSTSALRSDWKSLGTSNTPHKINRVTCKLNVDFCCLRWGRTKW